MSCCIINPQRAQGDPLLPRTGILAVNPADCACFTRLARQYQLNSHFLFNAQLFSGPALFVAGPAVGAPMAVLCLEKLIALGAERILVYGWCGSLNPDLRVGDLFLPTAGLSEEGTSSHYPPPAQPCEQTLHQALDRALADVPLPVRHGAIWTTDAVYRETCAKVERYRMQGIMAVDMEYTALRAAAAFRGVDLAAMLLVSDELFHPQWQPRFVHKEFRRRSHRLLAQLCAFLHSGEV